MASLRYLQRHFPGHGKRRVRTAALVGLVGAVLMQLVAPSALAQESEANPLVTGLGEGAFGVDAMDPLAGMAGCRFQTEVTQADEITAGTFRCRMSDEAIAAGVPFAALDGTVTTSSDISAHRATISGTASLVLPDQQVLEDAEFVGRVREGRADAGGLRLIVLDQFDGYPGDTLPDDGHYSLPRQTLSEGFVRVDEPAEPDPEPPPDPDPEEDQGNHEGGQGGVSPPAGAIDVGVTEDVPVAPTGSASTARLMALLAQASPTGMPTREDITSVMGPFPVAGLAWWQDDWHAYRCCPHQHLHQGLDMFAVRGTPVVAAADGVISQKVIGAVSGLGVEVTDASGTQYFYAHLDGFAAGLEGGQRVSRGEILGYVGSTGNARGTSSHLHFEIQPGGIPVPPKPFVDMWLAIAEAKAEALVEQHTGAEAEEGPLVQAWLNRAWELAGDSSGELSGEGLIETVPAEPAANSVPVASGTMILFAAGMFLLVLVGPGVAGGRRQARQLRARAAPGQRLPARGDPKPAGSRLRAAR